MAAGAQGNSGAFEVLGRRVAFPVEVLGRRVAFPVEVRDASGAVATFLVPVRAARRLLGDDALQPVTVLPGRTLVSVGAIDYRDNDLGAYREVAVVLHVRPRAARRGVPIVGALLDFARGRSATYIHRLPVDDEFSRAAGREIWGFPKTVERIDVRYRDEQAHRMGRRRHRRFGGRHRRFGGRHRRFSARLVAGGQPALLLDARATGRRTLPEAAVVTYTYLGGKLHRTASVQRAERAAIRPGGARLVLGTGPIADELRELGLPKRPLFTLWMGRMTARFEAPEPFDPRAT